MYNKGLITGCFDIVHLGHLQLFKFAKKHCKYLVVGVENDTYVKNRKGSGRPIFKQTDRIKFLEEIKTVDKIVALTGNGEPDYYINLMQELKVDCLITNSNFDHYWQAKKAQTKDIGVEIILEKSKLNRSTSKIADLIIQNFS